LLERTTTALTPAIRQCFFVNRDEWESAAFELTHAGEAYGMVDTLLELLRSDRSNLHEEAIQTLRHLVNRLYEHLHGHKDSDAEPLKNASQIQHLVLVSLEQSLAYFHELAHADVIVESLLALGGAGHQVTSRLLNESSMECRALAKELLQTSHHPGVMRYVLDSLSKPYPSSRILDAIQTREDPEFLLATLRWVPRRWTNTQERNLRQIEQHPWTRGGYEALELIPEELQPALMEFVSVTGLSRQHKREIRQWIVRHGCPAARNIAIELLGELDSGTVQEIVLDGLDSEDPDVQAWATSQLRSQHVPDALNKLIDRLDSPEAVVQQVARQELQGFNLDCLLAKFEAMSPRARKNGAELLEKIDRDYLSKLTQEYHHAIRRRRIRALRATAAFGWQPKVLPALLEMLKDDDNLIRRTTIEVLEHIPSGQTIAALVALKNDPSERVRDTVEQALTRIAAQERNRSVSSAVPTS
ncbi:MAG: HEAT repeat domain-containing protein, partial [Planctomycetaceae bacterium]|nr:HEAT repeat domain-containing protein [Planctomycetaceae bacterium]